MAEAERRERCKGKRLSGRGAAVEPTKVPALCPTPESVPLLPGPGPDGSLWALSLPPKPHRASERLSQIRCSATTSAPRQPAGTASLVLLEEQHQIGGAARRGAVQAPPRDEAQRSSLRCAPPIYSLVRSFARMTIAPPPPSPWPCRQPRGRRGQAKPSKLRHGSAVWFETASRPDVVMKSPNRGTAPSQQHARSNETINERHCYQFDWTVERRTFFPPPPLRRLLSSSSGTKRNTCTAMLSAADATESQQREGRRTCPLGATC